MSAKPAGESLENARKLYSIYARTAQYFGECFLYNSNSIRDHHSATPHQNIVSWALGIGRMVLIFFLSMTVQIITEDGYVIYNDAIDA